MTRKMLIAGLLAGTRMTPAEQRAGRFLRSLDGHAASPAPAPAASPAPTPSEAPTPTPTPAAPVDAMDALELELGDAILPGSSSDDGEEAGEAPEPGVSEPEQKDDKEPNAELEAERQRANRLEEELREARKGKEPPKDDAAPETSQESDPAPKPDDYEFGEADSKFIADLARWNARQEYAEIRAREQLTTELNTIEDGWKTAVGAEDVTTEYPDFNQVVIEGAKNEAWDCTPLMALAIKSSPVGPHVAYELAKNPTEASRIAKLIPVEQAYEIGKLEGQVAERRSAKKAEAAKPTPPTKVASSAPPPPKHTSRGSGGQYATELGSVQERMLKEFR